MQVREDPWYWLRDDAREDKDVLAYLEKVGQPSVALTCTVTAWVCHGQGSAACWSEGPTRL